MNARTSTANGNQTPGARKRAHSPHQPTGEWCRKDLRLALYLRDGLACVWCGSAVEDGISLCLDHIIPRSEGGSNAPVNLLCSCKRCNDSRGSRSIEDFAVAVAGYLNHGVTAEQILAHLKDCLSRPVPRGEAKALLARRGSVAEALRSATAGARRE